jgi:hypothetical protein
MHTIFLGLILAFILWHASVKLLLALILLLVLIIAYYTTPIKDLFDYSSIIHNGQGGCTFKSRCNQKESEEEESEIEDGE